MVSCNPHKRLVLELVLCNRPDHGTPHKRVSVVASVTVIAATVHFGIERVPSHKQMSRGE